MASLDLSDYDELVAFPIFGNLPAPFRRSLLDRLKVIRVPAGTVVMREGDEADGAYLVRSGRLRVTQAREEGAASIGEIGPGQIVGELALLLARPRTATVTAIRDSELMMLPSEDFRGLVERHPEVLVPLSRVMLERSTSRVDEHPAALVRTITVVPLVPIAGIDDVIARLGAGLARFGSVSVVDLARVEQEVGPGAATSDIDDGRVLAWLATLEQEHRFILYVGDPESPRWTDRCFRQADRVLLVGHQRTAPSKAVPPAAPILARRDLVLLRPDHVGDPSGAGEWLSRVAVTAHHHVRIGRQADYDCLARVLAGRAVGLALGGGGSRGFAHLGIFAALEQAGVPVDAIGGTSVGAVMGATLALGWDHDTRVERALAFVQGRLALPTLPLVSLSSSRRLTERLRAPEFLGERRIEDFPCRYFCVSANLSRAEAVVHESGPAWWAMRASISLPGVMPPVCTEEGELLVDGGVINNVPVDLMAHRIEGGPIIGVDLDTSVEMRVGRPYPPTISGWQALGRRLNPFRRADLPGLADIVLRAKEVGGRRAEQDRRSATNITLLLRPPTVGPGMLDFSAARQLIEAGYRYTAEMLDRLTLADFVRGVGGDELMTTEEDL
jgi:NTE family protein